MTHNITKRFSKDKDIAIDLIVRFLSSTDRIASTREIDDHVLSELNYSSLDREIKLNEDADHTPYLEAQMGYLRTDLKERKVITHNAVGYWSMGGNYSEAEIKELLRKEKKKRNPRNKIKEAQSAFMIYYYTKKHNLEHSDSQQIQIHLNKDNIIRDIAKGTSIPDAIAKYT